MEIKSTETIRSSPFLHLFRSRFQNERTDGDWFFVSRQEVPNSRVPNAVMIVPVLKEGQKTFLIALREYRIPIRDCIINFPAGIMEHGETLHDSATRELKEETGLDISSIIRVSPVLFNSPGMTDESVQIVYVIATGEISHNHSDDQEEIEILKLGWRDITQMLKSKIPPKIESKAWLIFQEITTRGFI